MKCHSNSLRHIEHHDNFLEISSEKLALVFCATSSVSCYYFLIGIPSVLMFDSVPTSLKDSSGHTSRLSPRETAVADGNRVWDGGG